MNNYAYGPPQSQRQEMPLFGAGGVQVTSARFICGNQTYPIGSITSVASFVIPASTSGQGWAALLGIGGAGSLMFMIVGAIAGSVGTAVFFGFCAAIGIGAAVLISRAVRARKPSYGVMISTAGMQVRAVVHQDMAFVQHIIGALNQALAMR